MAMMSSYQQSSQLIPVSTLFVQGSTQRPGVPWHCLKPNIRTMQRIHCEHCGEQGEEGLKMCQTNSRPIDPPVKLAIRKPVAGLPAKTWRRSSKVGRPKARTTKAWGALPSRPRWETTTTSPTPCQWSSSAIWGASLNQGIPSVSRGART